MITSCAKCDTDYDDEFRSTQCPHAYTMCPTGCEEGFQKFDDVGNAT